MGSCVLCCVLCCVCVRACAFCVCVRARRCVGAQQERTRLMVFFLLAFGIFVGFGWCIKKHRSLTHVTGEAFAIALHTTAKTQFLTYVQCQLCYVVDAGALWRAHGAQQHNLNELQKMHWLYNRTATSNTPFVTTES